MRKKRTVLVLASGDKIGGGSGFQEMVEQSRTHPAILQADFAVVSNHPNGGVYKKALALGIMFEYWPGPFNAEGYQQLVKDYRADYVICSGWLKKIEGLNPAKTINIHPGPLPEFGGPGMYGHHVHEAVMKAFHEGKIKQSAVSMHFVNHLFDDGPMIAKIPVLIRPDDTPETLAARVNKIEHGWQSYILNEIIHERIYLLNGSVYYTNPQPLISKASEER